MPTLEERVARIERWIDFWETIETGWNPTSPPVREVENPREWTINALQQEIGRLQSILHYKVAGDPSVCVGQAIASVAKKGSKT